MSPTDTETGFTKTSKGRATAQPPSPITVVRDRSIMYRGLCSNCEKLETCSFPSTTSETWFCEEYSFEKPEPRRQPPPRHGEELPDVKAGLCVNCELRATCTFPKPPGGVWFCSEYE